MKLEVFRIECEEREETSIFSGKWEPLSGKLVKIYTVQPVSQDSKATDGAAKLNFASSLLEKFSADSAGPAPGVEGVLVTIDSADGGYCWSDTRERTIRQLTERSLSQDNLWKHCYFGAA